MNKYLLCVNFLMLCMATPGHAMIKESASTEPQTKEEEYETSTFQRSLEQRDPDKYMEWKERKKNLLIKAAKDIKKVQDLLKQEEYVYHDLRKMRNLFQKHRRGNTFAKESDSMKILFMEANKLIGEEYRKKDIIPVPQKSSDLDEKKHELLKRAEWMKAKIELYMKKMIKKEQEKNIQKESTKNQLAVDLIRTARTALQKKYPYHEYRYVPLTRALKACEDFASEAPLYKSIRDVSVQIMQFLHDRSQSTLKGTDIFLSYDDTQSEKKDFETFHEIMQFLREKSQSIQETIRISQNYQDTCGSPNRPCEFLEKYLSVMMFHKSLDELDGTAEKLLEDLRIMENALITSMRTSPMNPHAEKEYEQKMQKMRKLLPLAFMDELEHKVINLSKETHEISPHLDIVSFFNHPFFFLDPIRFRILRAEIAPHTDSEELLDIERVFYTFISLFFEQDRLRKEVYDRRYTLQSSTLNRLIAHQQDLLKKMI